MPSGKMRLPSCQKNPSSPTFTPFAGGGAFRSQNGAAARLPAASTATTSPSVKPFGQPSAGAANEYERTPFPHAPSQTPATAPNVTVGRAGPSSFTCTFTGACASVTRHAFVAMRGGRQSRSFGAVCVNAQTAVSCRPGAETRQCHTPGSSGSSSWHSE